MIHRKRPQSNEYYTHYNVLCVVIIYRLERLSFIVFFYVIQLIQQTQSIKTCNRHSQTQRNNKINFLVLTINIIHNTFNENTNKKPSQTHLPLIILNMHTHENKYILIRLYEGLNVFV